jgi:CDP-6-deoxy-D-xylo-4-hexulose-3-dehydrase
VAQLKKLPGFIKARRRNWQLLYDGLNRYDKYFILPKPQEESEPSWFGFLLTVREDAPFSRNDIIDHLEGSKIATRLLFAGNIVSQPSFRDVKYRVYGNLKNTDIIMNNTFWIGVYPGINQDMLTYIISKFDDFLKNRHQD